MSYVTAKPPTPSTFVPPRERVAFTKLLANIAASDQKNGTLTPTTTLGFILDTARELGVDMAALINERDD